MGALFLLGLYKINGVPIRRVNQAYVIATATRVDVSAVDVSKYSDKYFAKEVIKKKKTEGEFFESEKEVCSRYFLSASALLNFLFNRFCGLRFYAMNGESLFMYILLFSNKSWSVTSAQLLLEPILSVICSAAVECLGSIGTYSFLLLKIILFTIIFLSKSTIYFYFAL